MSTIVKEGENWSVEFLDRSFGGRPQEAVSINGDTGVFTAQKGAVINGGLTATGTISLPNSAVTTAMLAAGAVTAAKAKVFFSSEKTGTGASQDIAHGLGAAPAGVIFSTSAGHDGAGGAGDKVPTIAPGTHDGTNVKVTVSNGAKFYVFAWK